MLDIALIRERPDYVKDGMRKVGENPAVIDRVRELDAQWRQALTQTGTLKAERNRQSKSVATMPKGPDRDAVIVQMRDLGDKVRGLDAAAADLREQLDELMLRIPNIPHEDAPVGKDETENVLVRAEGELPSFAFDPKPHWELGPALGILDFDRGVKLSGSRFYVLLRDGARLQRALISWMLDLHVRHHGYTEAYPPYLVNGRCLIGAGNLPKFADNLYHDAEEDFFGLSPRRRCR